MPARSSRRVYPSTVVGFWHLRGDLPGDHPLIGRSAPGLPFEDGTRLGALLHEGKALLLNLNGNQSLRTLGDAWPEGSTTAPRKRTTTWV